MKRTFVIGLILSLSVLTLGCARDPSPGAKNVEVDKTKYLLAKEPPGAKSVLEILEQAKDGDAIVIVGRIGGSIRPFTGQAAFEIVDSQFKPCDEKEGDEDCKTPWDYCCEPDLNKKKVLVKLVDEQGQTLAFDAEQGLDLKPLQTVVIQGTMRRTEGVLAIAASGIYVKSK